MLKFPSQEHAQEFMNTYTLLARGEIAVQPSAEQSAGAADKMDEATDTAAAELALARQAQAQRWAAERQQSAAAPASSSKDGEQCRDEPR